MPGVPLPPGYIRPDPKPEANLPTITKSGLGKTNDGKSKPYSTISDYVECLVKQGIVRDKNDLIENYGHLVNEIFFQWVSTGQLGCIFAAKLAKRPRENRWLPIVQLRALDEKDGLAPKLNDLLDAASVSHEAAVIIFPDVNTHDEIVGLVNHLCTHPSNRWYWTTDGIDPDPAKDKQLIGLRWILKENTSVNYVLGFASLNTMPFTRQSPFTALFLRIIETKRTPSHKEDGRVQVHLADLDSTYSPQERHDEIWELTKKVRANHVEPHMAAVARARVTFGISTEAAKKLCSPRSVNLEKVGY